jgi:hypothetical protein
VNGEPGVLEGLRAIVERIETRLTLSSAVSSVEVRTSTRGVDVTVKAYAGSEVRPAGDAALDEYFRVVGEIERRQLLRSGIRS